MTTTDTAPLSARLRSLDDETMCFDAAATYGLIQEAASLIDAQALVIETQDKKIDALSAALTAAQDEATANLMALTDEQVIAHAVADYGSAEAAVKAVTDMKARILQSMVNHYKDRAAKAEDESARRSELLMEALNELATTRGERDAAEARAAQAVAERDEARAREDGMREALTTIHELSSGYTAYDLRSATLRVMSIAQEAAAALSPAQPALGRRILAPWNPCLAKLKDGEPFFVLLGRDEQAAAATRHWATLRELERGPSDKTASAYRLADDMDRYRAGLLTTETTEGGNG